MKRKLLALLFSTVLVLSIALAAAAGSLHFSGGVSVGSLDLTAVATGLGNDLLEVTLETEPIVEVECTNKGKNVPSGVNLVEVRDFKLTKPFEADENGRVVIGEDAFVVRDPVHSDSPDPEKYWEFDFSSACKNRNWTPEVVGVFHWTFIVVTAKNGDDTVTLYFDCPEGATEGTECEEVPEPTE